MQETGAYPDQEEIDKKRCSIVDGRQFPTETDEAEATGKKENGDQPEVHLKIKAQDGQEAGLNKVQPSARFPEEREKIEEEKEKKPDKFGPVHGGYHGQENKNGEAIAEMFRKNFLEHQKKSEDEIGIEKQVDEFIYRDRQPAFKDRKRTIGKDEIPPEYQALFAHQVHRNLPGRVQSCLRSPEKNIGEKQEREEE
jgi:hypothetical protein